MATPLIPRNSKSPVMGESDTPHVTIHIGGLRVSRDPLVIATVLGSCISVCLYDPDSQIGGMNHFMLPDGIDPANPNSARYGVYAMELLICELMKLGASRKNFRAKVFGGGHVLKIRESVSGVPARNIEFVKKFLSQEQIPIVKEDVGGYQPRRVLFHTDSSRVFVKYLGQQEAQRTAEEEMVYLISLKRQKLDGDVELF